MIGVGAVGGRAARQLWSTAGVSSVAVRDRDETRATALARDIGIDAVAYDAPAGQADAVVIAEPLGAAGLDRVREWLDAGVHVVTVSDAIADVSALLEMPAAGPRLVIGAGMAPGLTDVLAALAAAGMQAVEEIHVAKVGTAGPACARQHHRALGAEAIDWREGEWARRPGGSGRELCWFPDPIGGRDCYRAGLADALLLVPAFPGVQRVTARVMATRRDRLTSALPMLRRPHPEGERGAVRVEVRGRHAGASDVHVLGATERPGVCAGAVAAAAAVWAATDRLAAGSPGGLASLVPSPSEFLADLARRGVSAARFEGVRNP